MSSDRLTDVGVQGKGIAAWRPQITEWIARGEYASVLDRFEAWETTGAEWWTFYGSLLDQIPTFLIHERPLLTLRTVLPLAWAGKEAEAHSVLKRVEDRLEAHGPEQFRLSARITRAQLYIATKRLDEAMVLFQEAEKQAKNPRERLQVLNGLGLLQATHIYEFDQARASLEEYAKLAMECALPRAYVVALINLAWHAEIPQGRFKKARILGRKLMDAKAVPDNSPFVRMCALRVLGAIEFELGEETAEATLRECYDLSTKLEVNDMLLDVAEYRAMIAAEHGRSQEAEEWILRYSQMHTDEKRQTPISYWVRARLAAQRRDLSGIESNMRFAVAESLAPDTKAGTNLEWARSLYEAGAIEPAAEHARAAVEIANRYGLMYVAFRARLVLCACEVGGIRSELERCLNDSIRFDYGAAFLARETELGAKVLNQAMALGVQVDYARSMLERMGRPTVRVRLFGGLRVWVGTRLIADSGWARPRAKAIFAYLALRHKRAVTAEQLMEAFWPEQDPEAARNSLRVAITYVRNALEPNRPRGKESRFLRFDEDVICLDLGDAAWIDYAAFEIPAKRAVSSKELDVESRLRMCEQALEVLDGQFLPEYRNAEWIDGWDERAWATVREARMRAAQAALELDRPEIALGHAEAMVAVDRCDDVALDLSVRALEQLGRRSDAVRAVLSFTKVWAKEMGIEPPVSVAQMLARLS